MGVGNDTIPLRSRQVHHVENCNTYSCYKATSRGIAPMIGKYTLLIINYLNFSL